MPDTIALSYAMAKHLKDAGLEEKLQVYGRRVRGRMIRHNTVLTLPQTLDIEAWSDYTGKSANEVIRILIDIARHEVHNKYGGRLPYPPFA